MLKPECISCILSIRLKEIVASTVDSGEAYSRCLCFLERAWRVFRDEREATKCATKVFRLVLEIAPEIKDYYRRIKWESIDNAKKLLSKYTSLLDGLEGYDRFRLAIKLAIAGNSLDTGVAEYKPPKTVDPELILSIPITFDHSKKLYSLVKNGGLRIMYLLDNAGESVMDTVLVSELRDMGNVVVGVVKSEPGFQNDVTIGDIEYGGLRNRFDKVIETGTSASSIHLEEVSREFREELEKADLVIAKGMAHYEYLSTIDLGRTVYYLLIPKCMVIANSIGVRKSTYVVFSRQDY